jgi:class 3 adenylate cyclase
MRDPHQVFTLLESIFQAFDAVAKKRGIFKVETIGDCYVGAYSTCASDSFPSAFALTTFSHVATAVCGVPKANDQHAVQMARFARTAMGKFDNVVRSLELRLGPDTAGTIDELWQIIQPRRLQQLNRILLSDDF